MALRTIVQDGDPILKKKCRPVTNFDDRLAELLDDMIETLADAQGYGLAGPQVGVMRRVFVSLDERDLPEDGELPEGYEGDSFAFSDEVMDKCDVFLTPGGIFGSEGNRYIRITLCCPEELLKKATDNIIAKFGK